MAQLLVRNLEPSVVQKLRQRAAKDGVSMEEEHRRILRESLLGRRERPKKSFKEWLISSPFPLSDLELRRAKDLPRDIEL